MNLRRIEDRCRQFHTLELNTAALREEQERELSPEIVQEREVQRPGPAKPAQHSIHVDVRAFVMHGIIESGSNAFKPAFETLRQTSAASHIDVSQFPHDVLTTVDFASTIRSSGQASQLDAYQRPVQWVLTSIGREGEQHHQTPCHNQPLRSTDAPNRDSKFQQSDATPLRPTAEPGDSADR